MGAGFDPGAYGIRVEEMLSGAERGQRLMPLVARPGDVKAPQGLPGAKPAALFPSARAPEAALAGLLLYFDLADDAHKIAQDLETPEGSFWHGIVHRREPDAGNAAYWFRRTGAHAIFPVLAAKARTILEAHPGAHFILKERWDPFAFIDFCESARDGKDRGAEEAALEIQRAEWQLLFDFCARPAGS